MNCLLSSCLCLKRPHGLTDCLLSAACCLLPVVCCILPAVCCLLSAVCCLLFTVCCLLSAAAGTGLQYRRWCVMLSGVGRNCSPLLFHVLSKDYTGPTWGHEGDSCRAPASPGATQNWGHQPTSAGLSSFSAILSQPQPTSAGLSLPQTTSAISAKLYNGL